MASASDNKMIVGLDIGTSKIVAIVGAITPEGNLEVVVFLLVCDIVGRIIIHPYEIPVNITVAVIGSAIFLIMLFRGRAYAKK